MVDFKKMIHFILEKKYSKVLCFNQFLHYLTIMQTSTFTLSVFLNIKLVS